MVGRAREVRHNGEKADLATHGRDVEAAMTLGLNAGVETNSFACSQTFGKWPRSNARGLGMEKHTRGAMKQSSVAISFK